MKADEEMSTCSQCEARFYVSPSLRAGRLFCSYSCKVQNQTGLQRRSVADRFWEKVDKSGDCWLWTASLLKTGYGSIRVNHKAVRAHRLAYQLVVGPIPSGLLLRHSCDNQRCVNPAHLIPGTKSENTIDAMERGQHVVGEDHHLAKLSNQAVVDIRSALAAGATGRSLAKKYGVSEMAISSIKTGRKRRYA